MITGCLLHSTVLEKYTTTSTQGVQTIILRVQVSVEGVVVSYRSSSDQSTHQLTVNINIPLRSWTHLALQVLQQHDPINTEL